MQHIHNTSFILLLILQKGGDFLPYKCIDIFPLHSNSFSPSGRRKKKLEKLKLLPSLPLPFLRKIVQSTEQVTYTLNPWASNPYSVFTFFWKEKNVWQVVLLFSFSNERIEFLDLHFYTLVISISFRGNCGNRVPFGIRNSACTKAEEIQDGAPS